MTLVAFLILLVVAGICGAPAQSITGAALCVVVLSLLSARRGPPPP
jgi:hypothetical protein